MIGTTLAAISDHIESLSSADGEYSLVCARYGDRPVPAAGLRFESRAAARAAVRVATSEEGWRLRIEAAADESPSGLASAPIRE